jgi:hypothetical protein
MVRLAKKCHFIIKKFKLGRKIDVPHTKKKRRENIIFGHLGYLLFLW